MDTHRFPTGMGNDMRESPILFTGSMVLPTLDGRKTLTRRGINRLLGFGPISEFQPSGTRGYDWAFRDRHARWHEISHERLLAACPYGGTGDRIWGKETHRPSIAHSHGAGECDCADVNVEYQADGEVRYFRDSYIEDRSPGWLMPLAAQRGKFVPSIHMPRWATRITLELTGVRVERLQDISEADAIAEGIERSPRTGRWLPGNCAEPEWAFRELWEQINGAGSWVANPWVWVVAFRILNGHALGEPARSINLKEI